MRMPSLVPEPGSLFDRITTFLLANMLWFLCAVTVVVLPPATAALFAVLSVLVRDQGAEFFATFFGTMRRLWLKSTLIVLADVAIGLLLAFNIRVLNVMEPAVVLLWMLRSLYLFVALAALLVNLYLWPLMVLIDLPLRRLISLSTRMAFAHPVWSLGTLVLAALPLTLALVVPLLLTAVLLAALIAGIITWRAWHIIKRYATPDELNEINHP